MPDNQQFSKDELIGYHKGALNTLLSERNEMLRIVQITEQLMQAHLKELESLGVKITADAQQPEQQSPQNPPIPQSKPASQSKPNLQQTGQQGAQQRPTTQQRQVV